MLVSRVADIPLNTIGRTNQEVVYAAEKTNRLQPLERRGSDYSREQRITPSHSLEIDRVGEVIRRTVSFRHNDDHQPISLVPPLQTARIESSVVQKHESGNYCVTAVVCKQGA